MYNFQYRALTANYFMVVFVCVQTWHLRSKINSVKREFLETPRSKINSEQLAFLRNQANYEFKL